MDPRTLVDLSYAPQQKTRELDDAVAKLLQVIANDEEARISYSARIILRQFRNVACVIMPSAFRISDEIPPNLLRLISMDTHRLFAKCAEHNIPVIFALNKQSFIKLLNIPPTPNQEYHDFFPIALMQEDVVVENIQPSFQAVLDLAKKNRQGWKKGDPKGPNVCSSCNRPAKDLICGCYLNPTHRFCGECVQGRKHWVRGCSVCTYVPREPAEEQYEEEEQAPRGNRRRRGRKQFQDDYADEDQGEDVQEEQERPRGGRRGRNPRQQQQREYVATGAARGAPREAKAATTTATTTTTSAQPAAPRARRWKPCPTFNKTGQCPFGQYCRFKHGDSDTRERPAERPEGWAPSMIESITEVKPEYKKLIADLKANVQRRRESRKKRTEGTQAALTEAEEGGDELKYRGCSVSLVEENGKPLRLKLRALSQDSIDDALQGLRQAYVRSLRSNVTAIGQAGTYVFVPGHEPFRFAAQGRANFQLRSVGRLPKNKLEELNAPIAKDEVRKSHLIVGSAAAAEKEIQTLVDSIKKEEIVIRPGLASFTLEIENYEDAAPQEKKPEEKKEENGETKTGGKRREKIRTKEELKALELGKEFNIKFKPFWDVDEADSLVRVLKSRDFKGKKDIGAETVLQVQYLVENSSLPEGKKEEKVCYFRWVPVKQETKPEEKKEEKKEEQTEDGRKKRVRVPREGTWVEVDAADSSLYLGDAPGATDERHAAVYSIQGGKKRGKDLLLQITTASGKKGGSSVNATSKALLPLLNSKDRVKDHGGDLYVIDSSFLNHPTILLTGVNVLARRRVYAPNSSLFVQVSRVTSASVGLKDSGATRGASVTIGWADPKEATGAEVARVLKQLKEWVQVAELRKLAGDSRKKVADLAKETNTLKKENADLKKRVAELEKNRNSNAAPAGRKRGNNNNQAAREDVEEVPRRPNNRRVRGFVGRRQGGF